MRIGDVNTCGTEFPADLDAYQIVDNGSPVFLTNLSNVFRRFSQVRCPMDLPRPASCSISPRLTRSMTS